MIDAYVIATLMALLIGSNAFWAVVCFKLTNRLMSRNYAEYAQTVSAARPKKQPAQAPEEIIDPVAEKIAKDANAVFGLVV